MIKDPAFLFYSKDFYEGTRMMLPEERACYIDLLIYQHQNGIIPLDLKRVLMYCSGVDEATLKATLQAKFKQTSEGWLNERLEIESSNRSNFKKEQSLSGKMGQFWKKAYQLLSKKDITTLKKNISKDQIIKLLEETDLTDEETLKGSLKRCLSIYANEDANENENAIINKNEIKGGMGENKNIIYPFASENFKIQWSIWKDYKSKEFKFNFKTLQSEQAQLTALNNLSNQNELTAIAIMHQSMANGWKGFFELKNSDNGKSTSKDIAKQYSDDFVSRHLANLQS